MAERGVALSCLFMAGSEPGYMILCISVWWRDRADHRMGALMDSRGPFYNCDKSGHGHPHLLEPKQAPRGRFLDVRLHARL